MYTLTDAPTPTTSGRGTSTTPSMPAAPADTTAAGALAPVPAPALVPVAAEPAAAKRIPMRPLPESSRNNITPNLDTNAPPFEVRGCKFILGGAFLDHGGAHNS